MPHLSLPIGAGGPVLEFFVGVSQPRADALKRGGQPVPAPILVRGLIDTGASITSVDPSILRALGIVSTGTASVHTPSTKCGQPHTANLFDISLVLQHPMVNRTWFGVPVIEAELIHQGIHALIGRDILSFCLLTYDGQTQTFCLGF